MLIAGILSERIVDWQIHSSKFIFLERWLWCTLDISLFRGILLRRFCTHSWLGCLVAIDPPLVLSVAFLLDKKKLKDVESNSLRALYIVIMLIVFRIIITTTHYYTSEAKSTIYHPFTSATTCSFNVFGAVSWPASGWFYKRNMRRGTSCDLQRHGVKRIELIERSLFLQFKTDNAAELGKCPTNHGHHRL